MWVTLFHEDGSDPLFIYYVGRNCVLAQACNEEAGKAGSVPLGDLVDPLGAVILEIDGIISAAEELAGSGSGPED